MAEQRPAAETGARQTKAIGGGPSVVQATLGREARENAARRIAVGHQRLQPTREIPPRTRDAARRRQMHSRQAGSPVVGGFPVARRKIFHGLGPELGRAERESKRPVDAAVQILLEMKTLRAHRHVEQAIAGIRVGDFGSGGEVRVGDRAAEIEDRAGVARRRQRHAQQRQGFTHIVESAGHVERAAGGHGGGRSGKPPEMSAERIVERRGAIAADEERGEEMLGDRGVTTHGLRREARAAGEVRQPAAGFRAGAVRVEQDDRAAGLGVAPALGDARGFFGGVAPAQRCVGHGACPIMMKPAANAPRAATIVHHGWRQRDNPASY